MLSFSDFIVCFFFTLPLSSPSVLLTFYVSIIWFSFPDLFFLYLYAFPLMFRVPYGCLRVFLSQSMASGRSRLLALRAVAVLVGMAIWRAVCFSSSLQVFSFPACLSLYSLGPIPSQFIAISFLRSTNFVLCPAFPKIGSVLPHSLKKPYR